MKGFLRKNLWLSLCGLNCGLCPMKIDGHCGGCGAGNQACALARCSLEHDGVEYCFLCGCYPCEKYDRIDEYDSFITHQRQKADLERVRQTGIERYSAEQEEKARLLARLLKEYNDGRKKTLFCLAVNLLELDDLKKMVSQADKETQGIPIKEKAAFLAELLQQSAQKSGTILKLRKKPKP